MDVNTKEVSAICQHLNNLIKEQSKNTSLNINAISTIIGLQEDVNSRLSSCDTDKFLDEKLSETKYKNWAKNVIDGNDIAYLYVDRIRHKSGLIRVTRDDLYLKQPLSENLLIALGMEEDSGPSEVTNFTSHLNKLQRYNFIQVTKNYGFITKLKDGSISVIDKDMCIHRGK